MPCDTKLFHHILIDKTLISAACFIFIAAKKAVFTKFLKFSSDVFGLKEIQDIGYGAIIAKARVVQGSVS